MHIALKPLESLHQFERPTKDLFCFMPLVCPVPSHCTGTPTRYKPPYPTPSANAHTFQPRSVHIPGRADFVAQAYSRQVAGGPNGRPPPPLLFEAAFPAASDARPLRCGGAAPCGPTGPPVS